MEPRARPRATGCSGLPLLLAEGLFRAGSGCPGRALRRRGAVRHAGHGAGDLGRQPGRGRRRQDPGGAGHRRAAARRRAAGPAVLSRGYGATRGDDRVVSDGERVLLDAAERRGRAGPAGAAAAGAAGAVRAAIGRASRRSAVAPGRRRAPARRRIPAPARCAATSTWWCSTPSNPWGNGHCLPFGPNREPPVGAPAGRAGLALPRRPGRVRESLERAPGARQAASPASDPVESRHAARDLADGRLEGSIPVSDLSGRRVGLLTGVARPESVRRTVEGLGAKVVGAFAYPDHHRFTEREVADALDAVRREGGEWLVTTEKDAVRLPEAVAGDPTDLRGADRRRGAAGGGSARCGARRRTAMRRTVEGKKG